MRLRKSKYKFQYSNWPIQTTSQGFQNLMTSQQGPQARKLQQLKQQRQQQQ